MFLSESAVHIVRCACSSLGEIARSGPLPSGASVDVGKVINRLKIIIKESTDMNVSGKPNNRFLSRL